ncbi:hypothetical protein GGR50DRAFT_695562 [Xylaria sp. CBS 124048]|nr:hypothetical protein GGR50DRAFT_695562 [Xylaria sp. CBS 124048]
MDTGNWRLDSLPVTVETLNSVAREGSRVGTDDSGSPVREPRSSELQIEEVLDDEDTAEDQGWPDEAPVDNSSTLWRPLGNRFTTASDYIVKWIDNAFTLETNFLAEGVDKYMECDIDPTTGLPVAPVDYPDTYCGEVMSQDQRTKTSSSISEEYVANLKRVEELEAQLERGVEISSEVAMAAIEAANQREDPVEQVKVQIPCHLRPAVDADMAAVQAIYKYEAEWGYSVMDTQSVILEAFKGIRRRCLAEGMPFVVAVKGWYGTTESEMKPEVMGFALVTCVNRGIAGSWATRSSQGGKIMVIVKPEYRRQKIGRALVDVIMTSCSGMYSSNGGYQFVRPPISTEDARIVASRGRDSARQWWYLEMDVLVKSIDNEETTKKGDEYKWIRDFLEVGFGLQESHYYSRLFYDESRQLVLDKITFRHTCLYV